MQEVIGKIIFGSVLTYAEQMLSISGSFAQAGVERALTVPEATVRDWCRRRGIRDEASIQQIVASLREAADRMSDAIVMIASNGKVKPD
ncbi:MAG: hypothetical protein MUC92_04615 [Fimbriimonadaceae bacterium]|jgi:hypothetical protein|nr:hypothetical protein [Fimbriimonadaceae bacterium]